MFRALKIALQSMQPLQASTFAARVLKFHSAGLISSGLTSTILSSSTVSEFAAVDNLSSSISATCGSTLIRLSFMYYYNLWDFENVI